MNCVVESWSARAKGLADDMESRGSNKRLKKEALPAMPVGVIIKKEEAPPAMPVGAVVKEEETTEMASLPGATGSWKAFFYLSTQQEERSGAWWEGIEDIVGYVPAKPSNEDEDEEGEEDEENEEEATDPATLPFVTFAAHGKTGSIHAGESGLGHLEGELRQMAPPTTDGFHLESYTTPGRGGGMVGTVMGTRPSTRPKPVCAYEWRPHGHTAWLPARLECTEAAVNEGGPRNTEHACDIPAAGFVLRLQLPAGCAPAVDAFKGCPCFEDLFKEDGGRFVTRDPNLGFAETLFLCRADDALGAVEQNKHTFLEIGWNIDAGGF